MNNEELVLPQGSSRLERLNQARNMLMSIGEFYVSEVGHEKTHNAKRVDRAIVKEIRKLADLCLGSEEGGL